MARQQNNRPAAPRAKAQNASRAGRPLRVSKGPVGPRIRAFFSGAFNAQSFAFAQTFWVTILLLVFGLGMVLSSSSVDAIKSDGNAFAVFNHQMIFAVIGFIAMTAASLMPRSFWLANATRLYILCLGIQLLPLFPIIGKSVNGNRSWINLPFGYSLQPSEFLKIAMILSLGEFLATRRDWIGSARFYAWPALLRAVLAMGLVVVGSDVGTTIVMAVIALVVVWVSGIPSQHMRLPLSIIGFAGVASIFVGSSSRLPRIQDWITQSGDDMSNNYAWQSVHGMWAVAAGNITGVGLGMSKLKWSWIPEVDNDYIFAIIAEELGFLGAAMTVGLFVLLGYSLVRIARRSNDLFARTVTLGVATWITLQAFINIAVVLRILPVLGVPLPLISSGGSSLIAGLAAVGICLSFERETFALESAGRRPRAAVVRG
jgi:cell division protein FtsW